MKTVYFVYYACGSCNQGDRNCGLEEFDTFPDAEDRVKELRDLNPDGEVKMLVGYYLEVLHV